MPPDQNVLVHPPPAGDAPPLAVCACGCGKTFLRRRADRRFFSKKCRDDARASGGNRSAFYKKRNDRVAFALKVLRFMEKSFPAQLEKMRERV